MTPTDALPSGDAGGGAGRGAVRRATDADAPALTAVYLASFRAALPGIRLAHTDDEIGWWMRELVIGGLETWLAEVDGGPAALLALGAAPPHGPAALEHLYVAPELRGRGLGDELVALAKQRRPRGLEQWSFQANGPARRLRYPPSALRMRCTEIGPCAPSGWAKSEMRSSSSIQRAVTRSGRASGGKGSEPPARVKSVSASCSSADR